MDAPPRSMEDGMEGVNATPEGDKPHETIIELNVGGTQYATSYTTLVQVRDSMLAALFSGRHQVQRDREGRVFIDRNGALFEHVLDFLRDPLDWRPPAPELSHRLRKEFDFFGLPFPLLEHHPIPDVRPRYYFTIHEPEMIIGEGQVGRLWGIAVNRAGDIVVSEYEDGRVLMFRANGTFLREFSDAIENPRTLQCGVAFDQAGNILVADWRNNRIVVFHPDGYVLRRMYAAGSGHRVFDGPCGVAVDQAGHIYVVEFRSNQVLVLQSDGTLLRAFGSRGHQAGQFNHPCGIAVDHDGNIIVADEDNHRVQVFRKDGTFVRAFGSEGSAPGQFLNPRGVAVDSIGRILVTDTNNHRVQVFNPDGALVYCFGTNMEGTDIHFNRPSGIAVDAEGRILVCDQYNQRIQRF